MQTNMRSFNFVDLKTLPSKPRKTQITEVRGPYYEAFTTAQLEELLKTWGYYVDGFKFAGGVQSLLDPKTIRNFTDIAHKYGVYVNTGGFIERIVIQNPQNVDKYIKESLDLGFDVIEVSSGMFQNFDDFQIKDQISIVKKIQKAGLKAKPEISIMGGVGAGSKVFGYSKSIKPNKTIDELLEEGERFLEAGAYMLMVESEGITEGIEDVNDWKKDVIFALIEKFGHHKLMFEVSPEDDEARTTFKWYLKNISQEVNLMMNSKNLVEYNAWRLKLWGDRDLWKNKKIVF